MKHIDGRLRGWRKGSEVPEKCPGPSNEQNGDADFLPDMVGAGRFGSRRRRKAAGNVGFLPGTGVWRRNHWDMLSV